MITICQQCSPLFLDGHPTCLCLETYIYIYILRFGQLFKWNSTQQGNLIGLGEKFHPQGPGMSEAREPGLLSCAADTTDVLYFRSHGSWFGTGPQWETDTGIRLLWVFPSLDYSASGSSYFSTSVSIKCFVLAWEGHFSLSNSMCCPFWVIFCCSYSSCSFSAFSVGLILSALFRMKLDIHWLFQLSILP